MSSLMGARTNTSAGSMATSGGIQESPGLVISKVCPACKKDKLPGKPHPKCSRKLQLMNWRGEI